MIEALLQFLDRPAGRMTVFFLFAVGLFVNRTVPISQTAAFDHATLDERALGARLPRAATARRPPSWRNYARAPSVPVPAIGAAYESMVSKVKTDLVRMGFRSPSLITMMANYSDRRPWLEVRRAYERAVAKHDLASALELLQSALENTPVGNPMLGRDLLEELLQLHIIRGDFLAAESTFRSLVEARKNVGRAWIEELRANPEMARRFRIDPEQESYIPSDEQIHAVFDTMMKRAEGGRSPFLLTEQELSSFRERMNLLRSQGKVDEQAVRMFEDWHADQESKKP